MNAVAHLAEASTPAPRVTAVIAENLDILRRIALGEKWPTKVAMAQAFGRNDGPNMTKTLKLLHADGTITGWDDLAALDVTPLGRAAAMWGDFAEGKAVLPGHALVRLDRIRRNPNNPRKDFSSSAARADFDQLKASIKESGVKQNPLCRLPDAEGVYELVFGECRWTACCELQAEGHYPPDWELLVKVEDLTDEQADSLAFLENKARRNLNYTEEAHAFDRMVKVHGWSHQRIAEEWRYDSRKTIQDRIRILTLPQDVLAQLNAGELKWRDVREMFQVHKAPKADEPSAPDLFAGGDGQDQGEEPGSSPAEPPAPQGLDLSPDEALIIAELAAKAASEQIAGLEPGWVRITEIPERGTAAKLVGRQLVMFASQSRRTMVPGPFARLMIHSSGVAQWLELNGFYDGAGFREEFLGRVRRAAADTGAVPLGAYMRQDREGGWVLGWLNVAEAREKANETPPSGETGEPQLSAPQPDAKPVEAKPLTLGQMAQEDAKAVGEMARAVNERMAAVRVKMAADGWHWSRAEVAELEGHLAVALARGRAIDAAMFLTMLVTRAGALAACASLQTAMHALGVTEPFDGR